MTTASAETNGTPKKRITAKARKRVDELKALHAEQIANDKTLLAAVTQSKIDRLIAGLPEDADDIGDPDAVPDGDAGSCADVAAIAEPTEPATNGAAPPTVTWNDVVKASADRDASEWEWAEAEEIIPIKLGNSDKARLLDENAIDQKAKDEVDAKIETLKDQIKTLKSEADVILSRTEERNRACGAGIEQRRDTWKVGTCFAINTVRYVDRETGQVMHERPIEAHERQIALPIVSDEATAKAAQMNLGDVEPTDINDAESLLKAAEEGEASEDDETEDPDDYDGDDGNDDEENDQ